MKGLLIYVGLFATPVGLLVLGAMMVASPATFFGIVSKLRRLYGWSEEHPAASQPSSSYAEWRLGGLVLCLGGALFLYLALSVVLRAVPLQSEPISESLAKRGPPDWYSFALGLTSFSLGVFLLMRPQSVLRRRAAGFYSEGTILVRGIGLLWLIGGIHAVYNAFLKAW